MAGAAGRAGGGAGGGVVARPAGTAAAADRGTARLLGGSAVARLSEERPRSPWSLRGRLGRALLDHPDQPPPPSPLRGGAFRQEVRRGDRDRQDRSRGDRVHGIGCGGPVRLPPLGCLPNITSRPADQSSRKWAPQSRGSGW